MSSGRGTRGTVPFLLSGAPTVRAWQEARGGHSRSWTEHGAQGSAHGSCGAVGAAREAVSAGCRFSRAPAQLSEAASPAAIGPLLSGFPWTTDP